MKKIITAFVFIILTSSVNAQTNWPKISSDTKPWVRWWWMGSAVDEKNISVSLKQYNDAGFGGTEVVPIYGAKGFENRYIKYLSPQWMKMLDHTVAQSNALGMGVYISVGTGWPIGGSNVTPQDAASKLMVQQYLLKANTVLQDKILLKDNAQKGFATLSALMGFDTNGNSINLTDKVNSEGSLSYTSANDLNLYAIFTGKTKQAVKRAAPGGEGFTIDHFSKDATANYFKIFDTAFGNSSHGVKAFFNDSYEVYNADWTPALFTEFEKRRGYDLRKYFNVFYSGKMNDTVARLKSDYRETVSDLMKENFSSVFTNWTNKRKTLSVNQAHGSPGNLLDLYGAFDMPECETFGSSAFAVKGLRRDSADIRNVDPDPIMLKFASSAAHFYNKPLTSCETFTWLGEHFKTSWSQCKPEVDQVFLSGINHVFYHGTTYSPDDAKWPGWLFYASVNFVPNNSMWPHLKGLNNYIAKCQSVLQAGEPDNELKIYWPIYDVWNNAKGMDMPLAIHDIDKWLHPTAFYKDVKQLQQLGFSVDFVSDKMLLDALLKTNFTKQIFVIPGCNLMPAKTLQNIIALAKKGHQIIIQSLPKDVPGFNNLDGERDALINLFSTLIFRKNELGLDEFKIGNGKIILSENVETALNYLKINRETFTDLGLQFIRRKIADGKFYFIVNNSANDIDETISLNATANAALFFNPLNGEITKAPSKNIGDKTQLRIQLKSGQSIIIKASTKNEMALLHKYFNPKNEEINLTQNEWNINFKNGGPILPKAIKITAIKPWTNFTEDSTTQAFSGTAAYITTFNINKKANDYLLKLYKLYESAKVIINGKDAGLIWSLPYELHVGKYLKEGQNTIEIEVCNLMANRIRNMDLNKEVWRNYHEINFVNINYKNFDASNWKVMPSGLDGEVKLIPLK